MYCYQTECHSVRQYINLRNRICATSLLVQNITLYCTLLNYFKPITVKSFYNFEPSQKRQFSFIVIINAFMRRPKVKFTVLFVYYNTVNDGTKIKKFHLKKEKQIMPRLLNCGTEYLIKHNTIICSDILPIAETSSSFMYRQHFLP